jgi:regulator of protease activity HflC (stomatin/prohibitin superfamily)
MQESDLGALRAEADAEASMLRAEADAEATMLRAEADDLRAASEADDLRAALRVSEEQRVEADAEATRLRAAPRRAALCMSMEQRASFRETLATLRDKFEDA